MLKTIFSNLDSRGRLWAVLAPLMMFLEVAMDLQQPALMALIVDRGIAAGDTDFILRTGLTMVLCALIGLVGGALCSIYAAKAAITMGGRLRSKVFSRVQSLSFAEIDRFSPASLVTRLTNDVMQLQHMLIMLLRMVVRAPLLFAGGIIMAIRMNPGLSLVFAVILPVLSLFTFLIMRRSARLFAFVQDGIDRMNGIVRENLIGIRVVKALGIEGILFRRFTGENENLARRATEAQKVTVSLTPVVSFAMNAGIVAVLWFGGRQVMSGDAGVGQIMAFVNYLVQSAGALLMFVMIAVNVSRAQASSVRLDEVLSARPSVQEPLAPETPRSSVLEFRSVSFTYPGSTVPALQDISFSAESGTMVGIIGATGAGKSTLVALMSRLYDPSEGTITLGGINLKNVSLKDIRKRTATVLQESVLFSGTVEDNLRLAAGDAAPGFLEEACDTAQALEFLRDDSGGFTRAVEQRGRNFSGGQKQRFSVARALARNPDILVLDDSTSAVDLSTEARMRAGIGRRMQGKTLIVVAQRVSAVMAADKILVIEGGRIVAQGSHRELAASSDIYRSIVLSQLGEEALNP